MMRLGGPSVDTYALSCALISGTVSASIVAQSLALPCVPLPSRALGPALPATPRRRRGGRHARGTDHRACIVQLPPWYAGQMHYALTPLEVQTQVPRLLIKNQ
jgi:hypothetical protein